MTRSERAINNFLVLVLFIVIIGVLVSLSHNEGKFILGLSIYGGLAIGYIFIKLLASMWYRPFQGDPPTNSRIAVIVPFFNEDVDAFAKCIDSLFEQTYQPHEVYIVDDGSSSPNCYNYAKQRFENTKNAYVHQFNTNQGKRLVHAWAMQQTTADIIVSFDSDTVLQPDAIRNGLKPFNDPNINVVGGHLIPSNAKDNILTRVIQLIFINAFIYARAAQTALDSVVCASGALSFWRRDIVMRNIDDYLQNSQQTWFGRLTSYGEDRRITTYAIENGGRAVYQETAIAYTKVPNAIIPFLKQQMRWNRSFFLEMPYALSKISMFRPIWWIIFMEGTLWLGFTAALIISLIFPTAMFNF